MKKRFIVTVLLLTVLAAGLGTPALREALGTQPAQAELRASSTFGAAAHEYAIELSDRIGRRVAGTAGEARAAAWANQTLTGMGYTVYEQPFTFTADDRTITSKNLVAVKDGVSSTQIVVGAHYDSVRVGRGAFDNATGVGLLLELAQTVRSATTPHTVTFVLFGAEETGYRGSKHFVKQMTPGEKADTVLMVNLDSVAAGDQLCVHSGPGAANWPQYHARRIAREVGADIQTNPGLNPDYRYSTTGDWSDHIAFKDAGIPYLYVEATNWLIGDKDGYLNTTRDGKIWHTKKDTIAYIETVYPGRMREQLGDSAEVLSRLLTEPLPPT